VGLRPREAWEDWDWHTAAGQVAYDTPFGEVRYSFVLARRDEGWYVGRWGLVPLNGGSHPTRPERRGPYPSEAAARAAAADWAAGET
jgi:hypothetical protein